MVSKPHCAMNKIEIIWK